MSLESLTLLAANPEGLYQANSEGFTVQNIISQFESTPPAKQQEIMTQVKLGEWLQNVFGINIQYTARLLSILQHPTFHQIFLRYCCTHYSKHLFSLSLAVKMIHSKLDHIRTPYNPFSDNLTNHGY